MSDYNAGDRLLVCVHNAYNVASTPIEYVVKEVSANGANVRVKPRNIDDSHWRPTDSFVLIEKLQPEPAP